MLYSLYNKPVLMLYLYATKCYINCPKDLYKEKPSVYKTYTVSVLNENGEAVDHNIYLRLQNRNLSIVDVDIFGVENKFYNNEMRFYITSERPVEKDYLEFVIEDLQTTAEVVVLNGFIEYDVRNRYESLIQALEFYDYNLVVHSSGETLYPYFACKNIDGKDGALHYGDSCLIYKNYKNRYKYLSTKHCKYNRSNNKYDVFDVYNFNYTLYDIVYVLKCYEGKINKINNNMFNFKINGILFYLITFENIKHDFEDIQLYSDKSLMTYYKRHTMEKTKFNTNTDRYIVKFVLQTFQEFGFYLNNSNITIRDDVIMAVDFIEKNVIFSGYNSCVMENLSVEIKSCFFNVN